MSCWEPIVDDRVIAQIKDIGFSREPYEACGVILPDGQVREVPNKVVELGKFLAEVEDLVRVLDQWANELNFVPGRFDIIVWHTHPCGGSVGPSTDDLRHRTPQGKYLVVTLPNGEAVRY